MFNRSLYPSLTVSECTSDNTTTTATKNNARMSSSLENIKSLVVIKDQKHNNTLSCGL